MSSESSTVASQIENSVSTLLQTTTHGNSFNPNQDIRARDDVIDTNTTTTVSAVTSAVLALGVLLLIFFIIQALKRRRRTRRGGHLNQFQPFPQPLQPTQDEAASVL